MEKYRSHESIFTNKMAFLREVANDTESSRSAHDTELDPNSPNSNLHNALKEEISYAQNEQKPIDILELCSGETLGKIGMILSTDGITLHPPQSDTAVEKDAFWKQCTLRAEEFLENLEELSRTGNSQSVAEFLAANRKMIGFCTETGLLKRLGQLISTLYTDGLLERDRIAIAHYPGSFNPFPHKGHAEVATNVKGVMDELGSSNPRVVISTVTRTEDKELGDNFSGRIDNLVRGFSDITHTSVLGTPSDLKNQLDVIDFRQHVAKLDAQGKTRHVMGSDTLISRIRKAREGDPLSNYLINSGSTVFLSVRDIDDYSSVKEAIDIISSEFDCQLVILPDPNHKLSGKMVRELSDDMQKQYFANMHIRSNN